MPLGSKSKGAIILICTLIVGIALGSLGAGFWAVMRLVLCAQCRVLGSTQHECEYFPSLFGEFCLVPTLLVGAGLGSTKQ